MRSPFLNGKQLGVVSVLDFHVPLTKTLDLSGEFINYETDWNHIPGPAACWPPFKVHKYEEST